EGARQPLGAATRLQSLRQSQRPAIDQFMQPEHSMSSLRRRLTLALAFGLALTAPAAAENEPTPAERLKAVRKEVADAEAAFRKAAGPLGDSAADEKKAEELWKAFDGKQADGFAAALELARADPESDVGFDAL